MSHDRKIKRRKGGSSHVRMSVSEYERIKRESEEWGKSIPELLREAYFLNSPKNGN